MIVWICTDMEGLAGIDHWDQCYHPDDDAPVYRYGLEQLTAEANAAIAGCFDAGATEVRILDGHGRNRNRGFLPSLDPRAKRTWISQREPIRWEGLDETVHAWAVIGQHAMAGTVNGFLDHTNSPKELCRFLINGVEHGEPGMMELYAGYYGVPLIYASGDEALCAEMRRMFPGVTTTPTKRGTGWATCELYPPEKVRADIRRDIAAALRGPRRKPWVIEPPIEIGVEWAWSEHADAGAKVPGVTRPHARELRWRIADPRDVFEAPGGKWKPVP